MLLPTFVQRLRRRSAERVRPERRSSFRSQINQTVLIMFALGLTTTTLAESIQKPAIPSPLASKVLLTDSANVGGRYVAVGLYGNIVYSDDGIEWRQGNSPTQNLLTNVFFIDDQNGWAGGHDTLILRTEDAGENWRIQYEDPIPGGDIPKPILDIVFTDKHTGFAAGAYGLLLETTDGGETWGSVDTDPLYDRLEDLGMEPEPNFNALLALDGKLLIVGELGTILLYDPAAETEEARWDVWPSPYEGTFFGVTQLSSGDLVLYGLRGNVYRAQQPWQDWQKITTGVISNIYDCVEVDGGDVVLLGSMGAILTLVKGGSVVSDLLPYKGFDTLVSGLRHSERELLLFGTRGVQVYKFD